MRQIYADGFRKASDKYRKDAAATARGGLKLANLNFDTGRPSRPGEYPPADKAYAELLHRHAQDHFARMPYDLAVDLLNHFTSGWRILESEMSARERERTLRELNELRSSIQQSSTTR